MESFLEVSTNVVMIAKYIKGYPHISAQHKSGSLFWDCARGDKRITGLNKSNAITQLSEWYGKDLAAQAKGEVSDVLFWKQNAYWLETHPIPDTQLIMYAERDSVAGNWHCGFGGMVTTRTSRIKAAMLLREWYVEFVGEDVPLVQVDQSIFVTNGTTYLEVLPIAPAPRMSASYEFVGALLNADSDYAWVCTRGDEVQTREDKFSAETLLFTWYCQARLKHDIFTLFTGNRMETLPVVGVPPMSAKMLSDGTWEVNVGDSTMVNRPHREAAIDMLRMAYDDEIAATTQREDNQALTLTNEGGNEYEGQPQTISFTVEAELRTHKYRTFWQPIAEMHNKDNEQIGAVGLRQDGNILVWLQSEVAGEFEYNIGVGQLPRLMEEAVQAHHEGEPAQESSARDIVTQIEHTLGLEIALSVEGEDSELTLFCRNLLNRVTEWQEANKTAED